MEKKANSGKFNNVRVGDIVIFTANDASHSLGIIQNWNEDTQEFGFSSFDGILYFPLNRWEDTDTYSGATLQYIVRPRANAGIHRLLVPHWKENVLAKPYYKMIYDYEEANTVKLTVAEISERLGYKVKVIQ